MRLSRLADYGVVLLGHMARCEDATQSAHLLAEKTGVPLATVSRVLFTLGRAQVVIPVRGPGGGFKLARPAHDISVAEIISAIDGPIALTQCIQRGPGACEVERFCPSRGGLHVINSAIRQALESVSLAELVTLDVAPWTVEAKEMAPSQRPNGFVE